MLPSLLGSLWTRRKQVIDEAIEREIDGRSDPFHGSTGQMYVPLSGLSLQYDELLCIRVNAGLQSQEVDTVTEIADLESTCIPPGLDMGIHYTGDLLAKNIV
jgi:hypothetical protein